MSEWFVAACLTSVSSLSPLSHCLNTHLFKCYSVCWTLVYLGFVLYITLVLAGKCNLLWSQDHAARRPPLWRRHWTQRRNRHRHHKRRSNRPWLVLLENACNSTEWWKLELCTLSSSLYICVWSCWKLTTAKLTFSEYRPNICIFLMEMCVDNVAEISWKSKMLSRIFWLSWRGVPLYSHT